MSTYTVLSGRMSTTKWSWPSTDEQFDTCLYQMIIGCAHNIYLGLTETTFVGRTGFPTQPNLKKPHVEVRWTIVCVLRLWTFTMSFDLTNHMSVANHKFPVKTSMKNNHILDCQFVNLECNQLIPSSVEELRLPEGVLCNLYQSINHSILFNCPWLKFQFEKRLYRKSHTPNFGLKISYSAQKENICMKFGYASHSKFIWPYCNYNLNHCWF